MLGVFNLDAVEFLGQLPDESVSLVWTDPPFGTAKKQTLASTWTGTPELGYLDTNVAEAVDVVVDASLEIERVLKPDGVYALLLDYRSAHDAIVAIRRNCTTLRWMGEIVYHFELGGVNKSWWTNKHNTIGLFAKAQPKFKLSEVPTTLRKAPRGKHTSEQRRVNSVWSYTMGPLEKERTGYPNQKPKAIVEPFVMVHTDPGDLVVDPFCGSGVVAVVAQKLQRRFQVNDVNLEACKIVEDRLNRERQSQLAS